MLYRKIGFIFAVAMLTSFHGTTGFAQDVYGFNQGAGGTAGATGATGGGQGLTSSNSLTATDFKKQVTTLNQSSTTSLTTLVYQQMPKLLAARNATPGSTTPAPNTPAATTPSTTPTTPTTTTPTTYTPGFSTQKPTPPPPRGGSSGGFKVNY